MSFLYGLVAITLAFVFTTTGLPKVALTPGAERSLARVDVPPALVRLTGVTELAGAIGLVVGIWMPWLGALAAGLLGVQMIAAVGWQLAKRDAAPYVVAPLLLLLGCAVALVLRLASAG